MTFTVTVLGLKDSGDVSVFERLGNYNGIEPSVIGRCAIDCEITIDNVKHDVKYLHFNDMLRGKMDRDKSDFFLLCVTPQYLDSLTLGEQKFFDNITSLLPQPSESPSLKKLLIVVKISDEKKSEFNSEEGDEKELNYISEQAQDGLKNLRDRLSRKANLSLLPETIFVTETSYKEIREIKKIIFDAINAEKITDETNSGYFSPVKRKVFAGAISLIGCIGSSLSLFGVAPSPIVAALASSTVFTVFTVGAGLTGVLAVVFFMAAAYLLHKQSVNEEPSDEESARLLPAAGGG